MGKALIGIMSCWRDKRDGSHDTCRATWLQFMHMAPELDYKFFMGKNDGGNPDELLSDEEILDVDDFYGSLPWKSQAIRRWALDHGYKWCFKADRDTYINPYRLQVCRFEDHDYMGHFPVATDRITNNGPVTREPDGKGRYVYASGGCGYWTSERAMQTIVDTPVDSRAQGNDGGYYEDLWVANVLIPAGMQGWHDSRFKFKGSRLETTNDISVHLSHYTNGYHPSWMLTCHRNSV